MALNEKEVTTGIDLIRKSSLAWKRKRKLLTSFIEEMDNKESITATIQAKSQGKMVSDALIDLFEKEADDYKKGKIKAKKQKDISARVKRNARQMRKSDE